MTNTNSSCGVATVPFCAVNSERNGKRLLNTTVDPSILWCPFLIEIVCLHRREETSPASHLAFTGSKI